MRRSRRPSGEASVRSLWRGRWCCYLPPLRTRTAARGRGQAGKSIAVPFRQSAWPCCVACGWRFSPPPQLLYLKPRMHRHREAACSLLQFRIHHRLSPSLTSHLVVAMADLKHVPRARPWQAPHTRRHRLRNDSSQRAHRVARARAHVRTHATGDH